jgi:hypothetical protein
MKELLKKWELLQRKYYNQFAVSSLAKYYRIIFEEETEWNKEFIVNALIADELTHRKEDDREFLEEEIEMTEERLRELDIIIDSTNSGNL